MTHGIQVFPSVVAAIAAGYTILSPHADSEGFLQARIKTPAGYAAALVRVSK